MTDEELLRAIRQAKEEKRAQLDLGNNQLTALPSEIGQLTELEELNLSVNELTALPPEIGQLAGLTKLNLGDNQLTALPSEIGQLTGLEYLNLYGNHLATLPPEIGQLISLTKLNVGDNELTMLPPEIGQLSSLQVLFLIFNHLTALPPEIGRLTHLRKLFLSDNSLAALPSEIGLLAELEWLHLGNNRLATLPPTIGLLTSLEWLHLGNNQVVALPPEIGQLTGLRSLDLNANQLTTLPLEIGQLAGLNEFNLSDNPISAGFPPLDPTQPAFIIKRIFQRQRSLRTCPRGVWTWLQFEQVEHLLHDAFMAACDEAMKDYDSGEVYITGVLSTSLRFVASQFRNTLEQSWQAAHAGTRFELDIDYRDLQKRHDVGGADLVIELDVDIPGFHRRHSFSAFQAKKLTGARFSLRQEEENQLGVIKGFTEASYYLFYPALNDPLPPIVLPARTLSGYLNAKRARSVSLDEIQAVGRSLADYLVYDFLPGWSGDERSPDEVEEFVMNDIKPRHLLAIHISAEGERVERREE